MNFANRCAIQRQTDHVILRFSFTKDPKDPAADGDDVAVIAVPLTTATELSLSLFESLFASILEFQSFFTGVQDRINRLNTLGATTQAAAQRQQGK